MQKQSAPRILIFISIIFVVIILFGIALGFLYSSLPEHHPQKNKQSCESVGEQWSDEQKICLLSYKETGEICVDGGQCVSGVCFPPTLTEEQKTDLSRGPLENIVGTCYPSDLLTGCVKQVLMGTISRESMCLDD